MMSCENIRKEVIKMKGGGSESQGQAFTAHEDAKRKKGSARWKAATVT